MLDVVSSDMLMAEDILRFELAQLYARTPGLSMATGLELEVTLWAKVTRDAAGSWSFTFVRQGESMPAPAWQAPSTVLGMLVWERRGRRLVNLPIDGGVARVKEEHEFLGRVVVA